MTTLFLWDWDDTLFPCYFFYNLGIGLQSGFDTYVPYQYKLSQLSNIVEELLKLCNTQGKVIILTNAEANWVEQCTQKFLPSLLPILKTITVISARKKHCETYPNQYFTWKYLAMKEILEESDYTNIICIGDNPIEHTALHEIVQNKSTCWRKSIHFKVHPTLDDVISELIFLRYCLYYFVMYEGCLDIDMI